MIFDPLPLMGAYKIFPEPITDSRGWFYRFYCANEFAQHGLEINWVQCNHSFSAVKGSLRGMHYQHAPFGEAKLVRCTAGAIFDVIVDVRADSPTFLKWYGAELSSENKTMFYIPVGFAHGFQTLLPGTEVQYQHSAFYTPGAESGLRYNDPAIAIAWPISITEISERDKNHPMIDNGFKGY